ncbi:multisubunit sodium/proton antiporter, MrpG subunit [Desulfitobacterium dichloroeliminans LMG P-21439]|uniref:Multisubunit sodium/proton antiporter, MrpG subunit n=2 Tax=Desulfitobacterium dichloroeliminans TaxID=233055 RepID=L0F1H7_DESDL|nr:multisubunit sodium/proton antiporter, MrpG subunit [Desulfitobacterium dichloroeliminans LMG P-21439]
MIMMRMGEVLVSVMIILGGLVALISAIGALRFPDVYTRSHAASKSSALGVLLVLIGVFLYFAFVDGYISIRLLLGIFFVFLTAPVGAHVICRAAYRSGVKMAGDNPHDELKEVLTANRHDAKEPPLSTES